MNSRLKEIDNFVNSIKTEEEHQTELINKVNEYKKKFKEESKLKAQNLGESTVGFSMKKSQFDSPDKAKYKVPSKEDLNGNDTESSLYFDFGNGVPGRWTLLLHPQGPRRRRGGRRGPARRRIDWPRTERCPGIRRKRGRGPHGGGDSTPRLVGRRGGGAGGRGHP